MYSQDNNNVTEGLIYAIQNLFMIRYMLKDKEDRILVILTIRCVRRKPDFYCHA